MFVEYVFVGGGTAGPFLVGAGGSGGGGGCNIEDMCKRDEKFVVVVVVVVCWSVRRCFNINCMCFEVFLVLAIDLLCLMNV